MDKQKAKKLAKLLEFEKDLKTNPAIAVLKEIETAVSPIPEIKQEIEVIKDDSQKIVEAINTLDQNIETRIENKVASIPPVRGDRGYKGEKGDPGPAGPKGDTVIVDKIIERTEVVKEQPIIKTEVVKEIKTDLEPTVIRDRLESLKDEDRLDASAVKGLEKFQKTVNTAIQAVGNRVAGVSKIVAGSNVTISSTNPNGTGEVTVNAVIPPVANAFTDLTDTFSDYTGLGGQGLRVNATEDGIDTYTPTDTDEKVKYNASDTSAGYLGAKTVAGTGIALSEGTGGDADKLVITNSAPDQVVSLSNGTGITTSGTYPSFTITNSAPDQTVSIASGTGISATGTYPSFTVTNTAPDQVVAISGGTGISTGGTYPNLTVTNTAPDQTVAISSGTGISVSGTYPNFTVTNSAPNETHTGEVTGATTLTVDKTAITNKTGVTPATGDYVLISDVSDTDTLKKVTTQSIADLKVETDPVWVSEKGDYLNKTTNDTDDITEGTTNLFDKTVSITAGTGMSVSGTYPNFTVTNNVTDTGITQLTGDVTAGPGSGSQATTIATGAVTNTKIGTAAVTYDKIQHVIKERLLGRYSGTDGDVQEIQLGTGLSFSGDTLNTSSSPGSAVWGSISGDIEDQTDLATLIDNLKKCTISVNINGAKSADGSQSQIVAGTKTYVKIPYGGTVVGWVVTEVSASPQAGSIVIDVVKDTTANYPPTSGDSIAGTEKPTLTTQTNNSDTTLSTWTTSVAANDYLGFIVDSVDGCSNVLLQVLINKI